MTNGSQTPQQSGVLQNITGGHHLYMTQTWAELRWEVVGLFNSDMHHVGDLSQTILQVDLENRRFGPSPEDPILQYLRGLSDP